jgi:hypothetical protein
MTPLLKQLYNQEKINPAFDLDACDYRPVTEQTYQPGP